MKKKVLFFARAFLCRFYAEMKSELIEPIFITLTTEEKLYLQSRHWRVMGCFEEEYEELPISTFSGNYLITSFTSDRFLYRFPIEKRREILGKEITFWRRVFERTNPDMLVNETVAVEIAEVMAIEAKRKGIPFYTTLSGFLPNTFYWKPDPFSGRLDDLSKVIPSDEAVKIAREYINSVVEKNFRPRYVLNIKRHSFSFKTLIHAYIIMNESKRRQKKIESKVVFKYEDYSLFDEKELEICRSVRNFNYDSLESIENKNILFYPMHLEPEATLSYFVEENYDQSSLIRMILSAMRNNQYLVVKEHPQQQGALSLNKFSELKKQYSNLLYLPSYVPSFKILQKSEAVVTLTSTAGWEALVLGKPVFVFGKIFYDQCPGVIRISNYKELKTSLQKEEYVIPNPMDVLLFAAKMVSLFQKGCPSMSYKDTINDFVHAVEKLTILNES